METLFGLSAYLLAALIAWLVAQVTKFLLIAAKSKSLRDVSWLYQSGNMPSAHTAIMMSLVGSTGYLDGLGSPIFAVVLVVTSIIAYDAMQVRRAAGEQGVELIKLLQKAKIEAKPHHALGHKPLEVLVGGALGLGVGVGVAFFMTHLL